MPQSNALPIWQSDSLDDLLAYASGKYQITFDPVSAGGIGLQIAQIANMRDMLDQIIADTGLDNALTTLPLWAKIWPASLILGHYLRHQDLSRTDVLEIGAGCGLTGLIAAALGSQRVWITDINEDALVFARINALKNNLGEKVHVAVADLESAVLPQKFGLIVGAEVLYLEHLYRPLVKFLGRHLTPVKAGLPIPEVILGSDHRRNAKRFFKLAEKEYMLQQRQVGAKAATDDGGTEKHLITLHRLIPFAAARLQTSLPVQS